MKYTVQTNTRGEVSLAFKCRLMSVTFFDGKGVPRTDVKYEVEVNGVVVPLGGEIPPGADVYVRTKDPHSECFAPMLTVEQSMPIAEVPTCEDPEPCYQCGKVPSDCQMMTVLQDTYFCGDCWKRKMLRAEEGMTEVERIRTLVKAQRVAVLAELKAGHNASALDELDSLLKAMEGSSGPWAPDVESSLVKLLVQRLHGKVTFTEQDLRRAEQLHVDVRYDGHRYTLACTWP